VEVICAAGKAPGRVQADMRDLEVKSTLLGFALIHCQQGGSCTFRQISTRAKT